MVNIPEKINCASTRGLFYATDFLAFSRSIHSSFHTILQIMNSQFALIKRATLFYQTIACFSHVSEKTSGVYNFKNETSYYAFLKKLFSKRYTLQPVYPFLILSCLCPWPWKVINWLRIWMITVWKLIRYFFLLCILKPLRNG